MSSSNSIKVSIQAKEFKRYVGNVDRQGHRPTPEDLLALVQPFSRPNHRLVKGQTGTMFKQSSRPNLVECQLICNE
ncbi:hypothetical protein Mapa_005321 [Marchantia paleacea]|nr:hypothetical protein Mapa_005321 [Marchantia paleacea]